MRETCALLVGVALEQQEFMTRASSSDFLAKYDAPEESQLALWWERKYRPLIAGPVAELLRFAAANGVQVYERATLDTFREATRVFDIVILFAHWKGPEIIVDDFARDATLDAFARRTEGNTSELGRWLSARWSSGRPQNILDDALVNGPDPLAPSHGIHVVVEIPATRLARRRTALDEMFAGLMRPGNRLELWDGMYSKEAVEAAMDGGFEGTLDLTTCTSTVLADYLSACRGNAFRSVQFAEVQELLWHARCVSLALRLAINEHFPYQQARALATDILSQAIHELVESTK